jgi:hypothetical protein
MRGSIVWFVVALAWGVDAVLCVVRHNVPQSGLTALFAGCFFVVGLVFRKKEQKARLG